MNEMIFRMAGNFFFCVCVRIGYGSKIWFNFGGGVGGGGCYQVFFPLLPIYSYSYIEKDRERERKV